MIDILITREADGWDDIDPDLNGRIEETVHAALKGANVVIRDPAEISIMLADNACIRDLNKQWRGKNKPTNVLSFPVDDDPDEILPANTPRLLGDMALALETLQTEAREMNISVLDHLRHLIVHGVLHLLGFDHETDDMAERMEALEVEILNTMNINTANPS
ncbi:MAG: rRNA maturation RNase YbeY [Pseudomonadota bacterium]|nr:rRNA maturation RNase YbeY [Pseudomonadota bacterium]